MKLVSKCAMTRNGPNLFPGVRQTAVNQQFDLSFGSVWPGFADMASTWHWIV